MHLRSSAQPIWHLLYFPDLWEKIIVRLKTPILSGTNMAWNVLKLCKKIFWGKLSRRSPGKKPMVSHSQMLKTPSWNCGSLAEQPSPLGVRQNHFCSSSWLMKSKVAENIENSRHSSETMIVATICNRLRNQRLIPHWLKLNLEVTQSSMLMTCLNQYHFLYIWPCWHWSNCSSLIKVFGYDQ